MNDEISAAGEPVDLFGAPVSQIRERWGRRSFAKSKENQELVALLRAAGWNQERIARYLGCDAKTLRKHFSRELEEGVDMIEGMALEVTLKKMRAGNSVAVARIFDIIENKGRPAPPPPPKPDREEPLGKKAAADQDAQTAHEGTGWGSLLPH